MEGEGEKHQGVELNALLTEPILRRASGGLRSFAGGQR